MDKQFYTMKELAELIPIGITNLYSLVHSEGFPSITINRRISTWPQKAVFRRHSIMKSLPPEVRFLGLTFGDRLRHNRFYLYF